MCSLYFFYSISSKLCYRSFNPQLPFRYHACPCVCCWRASSGATKLIAPEKYFQDQQPASQRIGPIIELHEALHLTMAPAQAYSTDGKSWDASTTIELIALILTIPGAMAALATLCIVLRQRKTCIRGKLLRCSVAMENPLNMTSGAPSPQTTCIQRST